MYLSTATKYLYFVTFNHWPSTTSPGGDLKDPAFLLDLPPSLRHSLSLLSCGLCCFHWDCCVYFERGASGNWSPGPTQVCGQKQFLNSWKWWDFPTMKCQTLFHINNILDKCLTYEKALNLPWEYVQLFGLWLIGHIWFGCKNTFVTR